MRRSLIRLLPIFLLAVLAIGLPAGSVLAEEECTEYDFTESEAGWSVWSAYGSYIPGTGFRGLWTNDPGFSYQMNSIIERSLGGAAVGTVRVTTNFVTSGSNSYVGFTVGGTTFEDTPIPSGVYTSEFTVNMFDVDSIRLYAVFYPSPSGTDYVDIVSVEICGEGGGPGSGLTMPLTTDDLHPQWGMYDAAYVHDLDEEFPGDPDNLLVFNYSDSIDVNVHAVEAGEVIDVELDITRECSVLATTNSCFVVVPSVITQETSAILWLLEMPGSALVDVRSASDPAITYKYLVSDPSVAVGDTVSAGCIIGKTVQLKQPPVNITSVGLGTSFGLEGINFDVNVEFEFQSQLTTNSVTVVRMDHPDDARLLPLLTEEPNEANCDGNLSGCVNGASSSLLSLDYWTYSDGVTLLDGGGVSLPGNQGRIYQRGLVLDDATTYSLNVQARATNAGNGFDLVNRMRLQVGDNIQYESVTTTWQPYSLEFIGEELEPDEIFGVINSNPIGTNIEIRYICVAQEDASQITNSCYFRNHHFDDPTFWTVSAGVTFQAGQVFTYNNSTVEQGATLDPISESESATYTLTVAGRLLATNAYTGQNDKSVTLSYRYPMSGSYVEIDEIDSIAVALEGKNLYTGAVDIEHPYILTTEIEITEHTNSLFSIKTVVDDPDNYLLGFRIDYVCLESPNEDGSFPGQDNPGGFIPPFYENCQVINTPQDNNVSSWTYYHWQNLRRFFDCTLMVRLNKMAEAMDSMFKTGKLFMRWTIATVQSGGRWLSTQLMPWLGGHFRNIALGQVTTVYESGGGTCSDLFCVLEALITGLLTPIQSIVDALLSIVGGVTGLLLDIISGLVALIVALITQLLGFLQLAQSLLGSVITAYNSATPVAVEGIPQCSLDPRSSAFCMGIWILDNTIFSGTGAAIIPLLVGILSIHLLIWVIGELKRTVTSVGGVT